MDDSVRQPGDEPIVAGAGATVDVQPPETIARLADDLLPALIARLDASGLGELEVRTDAWRIRLRKPYDRRRVLTLPEGRRRRGEAFEPGHAGRTDASHAGHGDPAHPGTGHGPRGDGGHTGEPGRPGHVDRPADEHSAAGSAGVDGASGADLAIPADPSIPAIATSPAVGYFTPREGWTTGRHVRSGDVVGHVDCLGVRQDVVAPVDGFIGRLLAQAGEAVEYGQPLVHVDLPLPASATPAPRSEAPAIGSEGA